MSAKELEKKKPKGFAGWRASTTPTKAGSIIFTVLKSSPREAGYLSAGLPNMGARAQLWTRCSSPKPEGYYDLPGIDIFGPEMLAPTLLGVGNETAE
jgi:hypothetical protein